MSLIHEYGIFSVWGVLRLRYIILFVIIFNALIIPGFILNGEIGQIKTVGGSLSLFLAFLFTGYCGLAPLASKSVRRKWCYPDRDGQSARLGLLLLGLTGIIVAMFAGIDLIRRLSNLQLDTTEMIFGTAGLYYLMIVFVTGMVFISIYRPSDHSRSGRT